MPVTMSQPRHCRQATHTVACTYEIARMTPHPQAEEDQGKLCTQWHARTHMKLVHARKPCIGIARGGWGVGVGVVGVSGSRFVWMVALDYPALPTHHHHHHRRCGMHKALASVGNNQQLPLPFPSILNAPAAVAIDHYRVFDAAPLRCSMHKMRRCLLLQLQLYIVHRYNCVTVTIIAHYFQVRHAQDAGAVAAIVYDDVYESLIIMSKPRRCARVQRATGVQCKVP